MTNETTASFGYWVRRRRQALDQTQAMLARQVGCATVTISKIERDERRPSRQMAALLAENLMIPDDEREQFLAMALGELAPDRIPVATTPIADGQPHPVDVPTRHNLPHQMTSLVGRAEEMVALQQLLSDPERRLITLLGAGGIGKTRLSLAVATEQLAQFADGVCFVSLVSADGLEAITAAIAEAVGFSFHTEGRPRQQLLNYLRAKAILLVLDNFEHLLNEVALIQEILATAQAIKCLVTSRQRLNLSIETLFHLDGLEVPAMNPAPEAPVSKALSDYSAVALFIQTARQLQPAFEPGGVEQQAVVEICQLVQGMPLGLILAAGWVTLLSPREIASEIRANLDFLETDLSDMPPRQRSMRAVFNHSWQLMSAVERDVLRQLSIFVGGFDRDAAEKVTGASLRTLASLANKSLLLRNANQRYELHELLRQYARAKLAENTQAESAVTHRHSSYYGNRMGDLADKLKGSHYAAALDEIEADIENMVVAWRWAADHQQMEAINQAMDSLYEFFNVRCRYEEGVSAFQQVETQLLATANQRQLEADTMMRTLARVRSRQGAFCKPLGIGDKFYTLVQQSLETMRIIGDLREMLFCLNLLGTCAQQEGNFTSAEKWLREALEIGQGINDCLPQADTLHHLGLMYTRRGNHKAALPLFQQGLNFYRQAGYQPGIALALDKVALAAWQTGMYVEAEEAWRESLRLYRIVGDRIGVVNSLGGLANVALSMGGAKLHEAEQLQSEALKIARSIGVKVIIAWRLVFLGNILNRLGSYIEAQKLLQEVVEICDENDDALALCMGLALLGETFIYVGQYAKAQANLQNSLTIAMQNQLAPGILICLLNVAALIVGSARKGRKSVAQESYVQTAAILMMASRHPANRQLFKDRAIRLLQEVENELSPVQIAAARSQSQSMTLDEGERMALAMLEMTA